MSALAEVSRQHLGPVLESNRNISDSDPEPDVASLPKRSRIRLRVSQAFDQLTDRWLPEGDIHAKLPTSSPVLA